MATPRIIFVNRVYWPSTAATAQLLTDLAEGLAARGWAVHVVASGAVSGEHGGVKVHRTGAGESHRGLISRSVNYWRFLRSARRLLAGLVQPGDVLVAMTDPPMLGAMVAESALAHRAAAVHWVQDIYPEIVTAHVGAVAGLALRPLRARRDAAWRSARLCVTLGEEMAQTIGRRAVPADRIVIVPNWAPRELAAAASSADIAARRAAWGVADNFVVAYSGNLGRVHEFATVLEAAERLRAQTGIVFLFIGAGARFAEVRRTARARQLANVRLLPPEPREHLAASLAAADAQLVTLRPGFAGLVFPSKLAGVLAAGRPVLFVGPAEGGIARLLAEAQCGATVAPGDEARLADTLAQWQADAALRSRLGRRARAAYEQQFTLTGALAQWEGVLQRAGATQS